MVVTPIFKDVSPWDLTYLPKDTLYYPLPIADWIAGDRKQVENIVSWVDKIHRGNLLRATRREPLVVELKVDGTYELFDGHHRLYVARDRNAPLIRILILTTGMLTYGRPTIQKILERCRDGRPWRAGSRGRDLPSDTTRSEQPSD